MDGSIAVDSSFSPGTRIAMELPLALPTSQELATLLAPAPEAEQAPLPPRLRVLLVDDSATVRAAQKRTLGKW